MTAPALMAARIRANRRNVLAMALTMTLTLCVMVVTDVQPVLAEFRAGAVVVDVTPQQLPVLVNGGMLSRSIDKIHTRVNARAVVLADDQTRLALVVVDSCMMSRSLIDDAKGLITSRTGIPADHVMISATHTHTAPASMGCLGTDADPAYVPYLRERLAHAVAAALERLQPARIGYGELPAAEFTALRRWIRRPDRLATDPFGNESVRANMHAGRNWDDVTGESGPEDPTLSLISIQTLEGKPLAVLGNFSMHYFGDRDISADYFGLFSEGLRERVRGDAEFVGILSHGCSGDIWRRDYTRPASEWDAQLKIDEYTSGLLAIAERAYAGIEYRSDVELGMVERRLPMKYRVPDAQRLQWARQIVDAMGDRLPKTQTEVYAREQLMLHEWQETEIVLQAIQLGDIAIATTPNETYAITGLKIKAASPFAHTMVIELANGGDGYIPPPEQHLLGGYNTWAARSAGLEVTAEPRIAEACIELLEDVSGQSRRIVQSSRGPAAAVIEELEPRAWWRLDEFAGPHAADSSPHQQDAIYEPAVTFFLEGPASSQFTSNDTLNRAAMFAGGRLRSRMTALGDRYSVSLWIWNGMPHDGREVTGWMFSRGPDYGLNRYSDHLGIAGTAGPSGCLIFQHGPNPEQILSGKTVIPRWQWQHVILVRDQESVKVFLNGTLEIDGQAPAGFPRHFSQLFFGGRSDRRDNWEGRLDEIAVFDRVLTADEIVRLAQPATIRPSASSQTAD